MPIYMDRHDLPSITAKDVAKAHREDLKVQDRFNCRALTYWFDKERGSAFCLIEAPDKQSVVKLHDHSHGLVSGNIIEVDGKLVETFLGRIEDPSGPKRGHEELIEINEPALRTILVMALQNDTKLKFRLGKSDFYKSIRSCKNFSEEIAQQFEGKLTTHEENVWVIPFPSAYNATKCALELNQKIPGVEQKRSDAEADVLRWNIGLSAGDPVTKQENFFGEAIQLGRRLCGAAHNGSIVASSLVQKLYKKEKLDELSSHAKIETLRQDEEQFLNDLMDVMDEAWNQLDLTVVRLSQKLCLSESQFYRKLSSITGSTPSEFINKIRLMRAARLIEDNEWNISRIALEAGFNNPSYFSKCFRKRFGFLPSDYRKIVQ